MRRAGARAVAQSVALLSLLALLTAHVSAKERRPVEFTVGGHDTHEQARVVFNARPNNPFVLTNFRDGHLSLSYAGEHVLILNAVHRDHDDLGASVAAPEHSPRFLSAHHAHPSTDWLQGNTRRWPQPQKTEALHSLSRDVDEQVELDHLDMALDSGLSSTNLLQMAQKLWNRRRSSLIRHRRRSSGLPTPITSLARQAAASLAPDANVSVPSGTPLPAADSTPAATPAATLSATAAPAPIAPTNASATPQSAAHNATAARRRRTRKVSTKAAGTANATSVGARRRKAKASRRRTRKAAKAVSRRRKAAGQRRRRKAAGRRRRRKAAGRRRRKAKAAALAAPLNAPKIPTTRPWRKSAAPAARPPLSSFVRSNRDVLMTSSSHGTISVVDPSGFAMDDFPQWSLVHFDDFETGATGWSDETRQVCGGNIVLGGYCKFAETEAERTFVLPPHDFVRVTANFHFIDGWKGEEGFLKLDQTIVWTESHLLCPSVFSELCTGINVCGDELFGDRMATRVQVTLPHTAPNMTVLFGATLTDALTNGGCTASWAIDDVSVETLRS